MEITGWDVAVVLAKAVSYAATLGAAGEIVFLVYCRELLGPALEAPRRRVVTWLLAAAVAASLLKILILAGSMSGEWAGMIDPSFNGMILSAGEARATGMRVMGVAIMAFAVFSRRRLGARAVIGAAIAATSFAWTGHVHAQLPQIAPTLMLCVHVLCAAFWLGALPPLLWLTSAGDVGVAARCTARFGRLAVGVVMALTVAGVCALFALLDEISDLWRSDYGRLFLVKLLLVAMLLGAAAINKLRITPRILNGERRALLQLKRSIQMELVIAALILLVTAAITTLSGPPR